METSEVPSTSAGSQVKLRAHRTKSSQSSIASRTRSVQFSNSDHTLREMSLQDLHLINRQNYRSKSNPSTPKKQKPWSTSKGAQVMKELLATERKFLATLEVLLNDFMIPLQQKEILQPEELEHLFANLPEIVTLQRHFLTALEPIVDGTSSWDPSISDNPFIDASSLSELFRMYSKHLPIFTTFCSHYSFQLSSSLISNLIQSNKKFSRFISGQLQLPQVNRQTLGSLLASVPQRICRYPLLLRELINNQPSEDEALEAVVTEINQILDQINQATFSHKDIGMLIDLQRQLIIPSNLNFKLIEENRIFLHRGPFRVKKPHQTYGDYALLFSDVLLLGKSKPGGVVKLTRVLPLETILLRPSAARRTLSSPMSLSLDSVSASTVPTLQIIEVFSHIFDVEFDSLEEKKKWEEELVKASHNNISLPLPLSKNGMNTSQSGFLTARRSQTGGDSLVQTRSSPSKKGTLNRASAKIGGNLKMLSRLDQEIKKKNKYKSRCRKLEAEVESLKKQLEQQSILIDTLQGPKSPTSASRSHVNTAFQAEISAALASHPKAIQKFNSLNISTYCTESQSTNSSSINSLSAEGGSESESDQVISPRESSQRTKKRRKLKKSDRHTKSTSSLSISG